MFRSSAFIFLLFLVPSCALFRGSENLTDASLERALSSLKINGEGRGRLGIEEQSYLFTFETLLKDKKDWIMAVTVPLHGEEVMVLHQMQQVMPSDEVMESFEVRIERELGSRKKFRSISKGRFIQELRSLIRFVLAKDLSLSRTCQEKDQQLTCTLGNENFGIKKEIKNIVISKDVSDQYFLELVGENLTGTFFSKTNFYLRDKKVPSVKTKPILSLELFWK